MAASTKQAEKPAVPIFPSRTASRVGRTRCRVFLGEKKWLRRTQKVMRAPSTVASPAPKMPKSRPNTKK